MRGVEGLLRGLVEIQNCLANPERDSSLANSFCTYRPLASSCHRPGDAILDAFKRVEGSLTPITIRHHFM